MPEPLTKLERRILDYLVEYLREHTYQPSIREIGRRFDIKSTKTVSEYLQSLADKGWIERDPARSRGVRLIGVDLGHDTVAVPHWQRAPGVTETGFSLDRRLAGSSGTFFVTMSGDSMTGAGIRDRDLLLVEPVVWGDLDEGDVVVARVSDETTVKRYYPRNDRVLLEPANPSYPPILAEAGQVDVVGRVISVLRRLRVPGTLRRTSDADPRDAGEGALT
ncbi:MAG: transcriptional repressor LexA [Gemmatimonadota bacterium]|jgi:repressor LexA